MPQYREAHRPMHRRVILRGLAGTVGAGTLAACGGARTRDTPASATTNAPVPTVPPGKQVIVAVTTTQLQDFVRNVGGDQVTVLGILKPNVDPHDYEPTVDDASAIAKADMIVVHGAGLDAWMDKTVRTANTKAPVVTATAAITLLKGDKNEPEGDPHAWFDPTLVKTMARAIANGLATVDPTNAGVYQQNAMAYGAQLDQLDGHLKGIFDQVPKEQRKLVTNHDAFRYLARRYDLTIVGAVIPSLSDSAEPSPRQINDLIDTIRKEKVKAIFAESSANPKVAQQVAKETGVKIVDTLYADTLGEPGSAADTYLKMMVYDAKAIAGALQ